ncbi:hypothetical protein GN244_ATG01680 [Phytophthora infestans]|uniref:Uncharacterized protein n=1 Tax=Phytophthora infestans TaxID=4787 RepID=A0A833TSF2_PHYIN|nr:hypothetical protein GN244_ATG01680 [Phytophthora infestans]
MPASVVDRESMLLGVEILSELNAPKSDRLAAVACQVAGQKAPVTGKKRALDEMQSDGRATARRSVEDTLDRTAIEREKQRREKSDCRHVDAGLPPMVPTKVLPKPPMAGKENATKGQNEKNRYAKVVKVTGGDRRRDSSRPQNATKKTKLGKHKTSKKAANKPEEERRRKRKAKDASASAGISQSSAKMLFQCSCQLLSTQALEYDVRAREMEERNATQAKEIEEWERKIRSLKRELEEYADELPSGKPTGRALVEAGPASFRATGEQLDPLSAMATAATLGAAAEAESSLPPAVITAEARLQEELRKRAQKMNEFCRSVPGFLESLDKHAPF